MGLSLGFTQVGLNLGLTLNISYHYTTPTSLGLQLWGIYS